MRAEDILHINKMRIADVQERYHLLLQRDVFLSAVYANNSSPATASTVCP